MHGSAGRKAGEDQEEDATKEGNGPHRHVAAITAASLQLVKVMILQVAQLAPRASVATVRRVDAVAVAVLACVSTTAAWRPIAVPLAPPRLPCGRRVAPVARLEGKRGARLVRAAADAGKCIAALALCNRSVGKKPVVVLCTDITLR